MTERIPSTAETPSPLNREGLDFIRSIVAEDLRSGKYETIVTRFPPEPNGYLHIGHAKAILLNHGIAQETGGRFHLRFDDTNPETEDVAYVNSIIDTVRWLGADFGEHLFYAADYFEEMYRFAEFLIQDGHAYVDSATEEEIRDARGTVTEPGRPTRFRDRSREESLDLFRRMRAGEFPDGAHVLRGRIDLASPNMLLRDPILYRIRHAHHYRTGDAWCIYPLYDYAHPLEDAIERITHSLCTLEFDNNRAVYDWVVDHWQDFVRAQGGEPARPRQYEFARGAIEYTMTSKRKLLELVNNGLVAGWDDPRLPTLAGLRRRGVTPGAIRSFWDRMGVAKFNSRIDVAKFDYAIRDDLNQTAPRVLCVLNPLKVVLTNYPAGQVERLEAPYFPHDVPKEGSRTVPFSAELYIERDDFAELPPRGFHRLSPGAEVRLRHGYVIRCQEVVKNDAGEVVELRCSYDPATRGGNTPDGRPVKGTIHWVSAAESLPCEVRLYDRLFTVAEPEATEGDFKDYLNPDSLVVVAGARIEPSVANDPAGSAYQFERLGYFCSDLVDSAPGRLVFNRTVTLRDAWTKAATAPAAPAKPKAEPRVPQTPQAAEIPERAAELEAARLRYLAELGLAPAEADLLTRGGAFIPLFEATVGLGVPPRAAAGMIVNDLIPELKENGIVDVAFMPEDLRALIALVEEGEISRSSARVVLGAMARGEGQPAALVERLGLRQMSDDAALVPLVERVLAENPAKVDEYRGGRAGLLGFFTGQVMRLSGGSANPERVQQLLRSRLG